jgi:hypothetical protein
VVEEDGILFLPANVPVTPCWEKVTAVLMTKERVAPVSIAYEPKSSTDVPRIDSSNFV